MYKIVGNNTSGLYARLACVAALFWGRVSVLQILKGLKRNARKKREKIRKAKSQPTFSTELNLEKGTFGEISLVDYVACLNDDRSPENKQHNNCTSPVPLSSSLFRSFFLKRRRFQENIKKLFLFSNTFDQTGRSRALDCHKIA